MNQKNEYQPKNLSEFVQNVRMGEEEVERLGKKIEDMHTSSKYNSKYG